MLQTIRSFFTKTIKRNLITGIALTHAILMSLFIYDMTESQKTFLETQSLSQTKSLATTLSKNATSWVLANDYIGMDEIVASINSYPYIRYAMLLDIEGKVLAHTTKENINHYITDQVSLELKKTSKEVVLLQNSDIIDVAIPIAYKTNHIGWARVGIDQHHIKGEIDAITYKGMFYTLGAIFLGWLFAIFMANKLSDAIFHIVAITKKISNGEWNQRIAIQRDDEIGTLISHINLMLDQLQKKEDEVIKINESLHESEFKWKFAVEGNGSGLWDWNMKTNEIYFSKQWKNMLGYEEDEIGNTLQEWEKRVHPYDLQKANADLQKHLDGIVDIYQNEHRILCKDGTYKWILDRGVIVDYDQYGAPTRMIGTHSDISETKKLNLELADLNKNLERKVSEQTQELREINKNLEAKVQEQLNKIRTTDATLYEQAKLASMGEMIGNIAHQWRQPLSVISTLASAISFKKEYGQLDQNEIIPNMDQIINQTQYLSKTIDDFRNFIKGKQAKEEFFVCDLFDKTLSIVTPSLKNNYIQLIQNIDCDFKIDGYENELIQALINVINNSKDALTMDKNIVDKFIFLEAKRIEDRCEIIIRDNGGGIDQAIIHRIFEPYFTTKHQYQGTGLGLAMTHKIITEMHGGTIDASNVEYTYNGISCKGACIKIVL